MARKKVDETATREELTALVEELNSVLGLEPALVVTKKMSDEDIIEKIKEIATGNVYETDFEAVNDNDEEGVHYCSEASKRVFGILQIEVAPGAPPAVEGDDSADSEGDEPEVVEETKPAKTSKKGEEAPAEKAPAKVAKSTPTKKESSTKKEASTRYTRSEALVDAIDAGKGTKDEIIERSNKFFVKENPSAGADKTTARSMLGYVLPTLILIGYVTYVNGVITPVKAAK